MRQIGPDGKPKKKARVEEHSSDEEHGDFDPQQLREHEEFTKVAGLCQSGGNRSYARIASCMARLEVYRTKSFPAVG